MHQDVEVAYVIIVLGSHDTRVAERGAQLFLDGLAPRILFSGGLGRLTANNWTDSEAEIFSKIAINMGVPESAILIENKSTNTGENISFSMNLLEDHGMMPKSVILVHKPYMERRQFATWMKLFPDIKASITSPQISYENYPNDLISKDDMINIIVGDTQRVKLYSEKGFMIDQQIPNNVWDAYQELVRRGYNKQLINCD
ncbi:MAG: YdcF family protein [Candidatus Levybacteria bacterium]|nr:YdcF family protein [Candidatus Levybacteria bacterium]